MKMRTLLLGVILGLLAVVHSTPDNTVTQNPAKPDEAFLKDAMTEGFIVGPPPTLTTVPPQINTTVQPSQQPVPNSEDMTEGSAVGETNDMSTTSVSLYATTALSVSQAPTSESTESYMFEASGLGQTNDESTTAFPLDTTTAQSVSHVPTSNSAESSVFEGNADESTAPFTLDTTIPSVSQAPTSSSTESYIFEGSASGELSFIPHMTTTSVPSEVQSSITSNYDVISQTTDAAVSSGDFQSTLSSGSGSGDMSDAATSTTLTSSSITEPSTLSSIKGRNLYAQGTHKDFQTYEQKRNGHVTPDWIIILGFIVGVAALVMLCVAIATRHKWNRPNQANLSETKSNSSNQQREQEMETFLPNGKPKENGNSGEYTIISLEDLPENDPSQ